METDNFRRSIMVVDDDEYILNALFRELTQVGRYRVETFASPEDAYTCAGKTRFDLLITDYRMPRMHGLTFINRFAQLQPHTPVIIISGDADMALRHGEFNDVEIPYLIRKPWQTSELLKMVAEVLGEDRV